MSEKLTPETSAWGWKALIIAFVLSMLFMGFFYLAVNNEPDYMPSQKRKAAQENVAPATAEQHQMSAEEHAAMPVSSEATNQGH